MNWSVLRLVGDHTRRLFGLWLLVAALQIMQTSALWVLELDRMPLIGAMMCAMAYFATSASPLAVMRTLPIRRRSLALYRWWMLIGVPSLLLYACVGIAWINHFRWPHAPSELQAGAVFLAMVGSLGVLSVLPLPALAGNLSNLSRFAAVWVVLAGFALYGFPVELVTTPVALALGVGGVAIAIASLVMACRGEILAFQFRKPAPKQFAVGQASLAPGTRRSRLKGWHLLFAQMARTALVLAAICIVCATAVRYFLPGLVIALPLIFVAVAGSAGALLARRWLNAVGALQCLPVRDRTTALVVWTALTAPGLFTCLASNAVNALVPSWGVAVPALILPVFVVIPLLLASGKTVESGNGLAASAQQWSPVIQLSMWPLWAGSFFSLVLTKLAPVWAGGIAAAITAVVGLIGYFAVLSGVRAGRLVAGVFVVACLAVMVPAHAASQPISDKEKAQLIDGIVTKVNELYVVPEDAPAIGAAIRAKQKQGAYRDIQDGPTLAKQLGDDLREAGHDLHFRVDYFPDGAPDRQPAPPDAQAAAAGRARTASLYNNGFVRVERLNGNVGYINLRIIPGREAISETAAAAMTMVRHTDALIIDLRENTGGDMEGTAHFLSYFTQGRVPVMRFVSRASTDRMETWTDETLPGPRYDASKPVFVLTSHDTFSGGEEVAYDFQAIKRARIVGEISRGGGRAAMPARVSEHFVVGVPYYEAQHSVTGTGWNNVGVKPDIPAAAAEAQTVAYRLALEHILGKATDPVLQTRLQQLLSGLKTK